MVVVAVAVVVVVETAVLVIVVVVDLWVALMLHFALHPKPQTALD